MEVELEGAVDNLTGGVPVVEDQNAWKWAAGIAGSIVVALFGWVIKRQQTGQALEDTENTTKTDLIQRLQTRNRELEEQLGDIMAKSVAGYDEIGQAKRAANQASIEADNARAAARRAEEAAVEAKSAAQAADNVASRRLAYIHELRAALQAAGVTVPPWPEGVL